MNVKLSIEKGDHVVKPCRAKYEYDCVHNISTVLPMSILLSLVKHFLSFRLCPIIFIFNGVQCFGSWLYFHLHLKWEVTPILLDHLARGTLSLLLRY